MVAGLPDALLRIGSLVALAAAILFSLVVLTRYSDDETLVAPLRKRLVLGVPWGTLIVIALVYAVYRLLQGGAQPGGPIVVGFRSWSLWYPQGILLSSFSHASQSHVIGNLLGTVAFAPIVEYAWSHYPQRRGTQSFSSWRTNPFVRIGLFVVAVFGVGLAGAVLVPGAVIGFSGVVFAFAGFAIVTRPITSVLAILGIQAVSLLRRAVLTPFETAGAEPTVVSPGWANTALQGHLFGLVVGVLLGALLLQTREQWPSLRRIWFAALVFSVSRSMYAVYWYLGADQFVFFRGIGTAGVLVLASVVALTALSWDRPVLDPVLSAGVAAAGVLLVIVCALALVGVPYNLVPVSEGPAAADGIEVRDYTVNYVEDAENQYISALQVPVVRDSLSVEMSGVVITSERRNAWSLTTSATSLAQYGGSYFAVGDSTWRETVYINRTEWTLVGENTTYKVYGSHDGPRKLLFTAEPAVANPVINGSRVWIDPSEEGYDLFVTNGSTVTKQDGALVVEEASILGRESVPGHNESVQIGGIQFERTENTLVAISQRTRIDIATYRTGGQLETLRE
jgi:membrane associated rhomboid family serine protease